VWHVLHNVQTVIAIELMVAAQGVDFSRVNSRTKKHMKAGKGVEAAHKAVRKHIQHLHADRALYDDIQSAHRMVRDNSILRAVEQTIGKLN
jgi:histidine ammonia-lyase